MNGTLGARPPDHLSTQAKHEWRRLVARLEAMPVATSVDGDALCLYCESWATWKEATKHVREDGLVVKAGNGYPIQNPYLSIANAAWDQCRRMLIEFGLTPAARSKVSATTGKPNEPPKENGKSRLLGGAGPRLAG